MMEACGISYGDVAACTGRLRGAIHKTLHRDPSRIENLLDAIEDAVKYLAVRNRSLPSPEAPPSGQPRPDPEGPEGVARPQPAPADLEF